MTNSDQSSVSVEVIIRRVDSDGSVTERRFAEESTSELEDSDVMVGERVYDLGTTAARHFGYVR